jgi:enoyl-CoA hydratase/carnithine racemase
MRYSTIITEEKDGILTVTLNRPDAMNALNLEMIKEMTSALGEAEENKNVKVLIITAVGKVFCAGADLKEIEKFLVGPHVLSAELDGFSQTLNRMINKIEKLKKPVIAAINGYALAGGLELVLVCDLAVCADSAKFGDQHANVGLLPGSGGSQRLPRLIGIRKALELLFTGDMITAEEAKNLSLVNKVVPDDQLLSASKELAKRIAVKSALVSETLKELVYHGMQVDLSTALELERGAVVRHHNTHDMKEGIRSFIEKRKPVFTGK